MRHLLIALTCLGLVLMTAPAVAAGPGVSGLPIDPYQDGCIVIVFDFWADYGHRFCPQPDDPNCKMTHDRLTVAGWMEGCAHPVNG